MASVIPHPSTIVTPPEMIDKLKVNLRSDYGVTVLDTKRGVRWYPTEEGLKIVAESDFPEAAALAYSVMGPEYGVWGRY